MHTTLKTAPKKNGRTARKEIDGSAVVTKVKLSRPFFTRPGQSRQDVYGTVKWGPRDAVITGRGGEKIFEQRKMLFPKSWSDTAVQIVAQKYFKGPLGTKDRETSLTELIDRVADTIAKWARQENYLDTGVEELEFGNEIAYLMLHQYASFNSPVWFNLGTRFSSNPDKPQCSACFINKVDDNMESILHLLVKEGRIFKDGSGSGVNLSTLRSKREMLSGGGRPSGPVSFMKSLDTNAGQIKSGGKTRRAAKMVILNTEHPDILEFIRCKAEEEKKIPGLLAVGYSTEFNATNNAYEQVFFQNANNSVRAGDDFMHAASDLPIGIRKGAWWTKNVTNGEPCEQHVASDILDEIAQATWACGDPGMQFDDTINRWNPVLQLHRISASNPCSEYMFIDDSSCNLASFNLMKFVGNSGFDAVAFQAACRVMILAMEVIVGRAGYPTQEIETNSYLYRPLGLGFANLGALLMTSGVAYDSDEGRAIAGAITSYMSACAFGMSAEIAHRVGPFQMFDRCKDGYLKVIRMHLEAANELVRGDKDRRWLENQFSGSGEQPGLVTPDPVTHQYSMMASVAKQLWIEALELAGRHGMRNAQLTLLAPTGTIGFMMDCATFGVEPELSLVKYKNLVGGGLLKLVNPLVPEALTQLGYEAENKEAILAWVDVNEHLEGSPGLNPAHLPIFDTSFPPQGSKRYIDPIAHIKMMQAVQPFLSGAISKTVNLPEHATAQDIRDLYIEAWKRGLKAVAIYRNNCKKSQPLSVTRDREVVILPAKPAQQKLPDTRESRTHKFRIGDHRCYLTVGLYKDGRPGEIFVQMSKEGSTMSGLVDSWATSVSYCLQYGVSLEKIVQRFSHTRFEPAGYTKEMGYASSIVDYVCRWLEKQFSGTGDLDLQPEISDKTPEEHRGEVSTGFASEAPFCGNCGALMTVNGSCFVCSRCGTSSGCS